MIPGWWFLNHLEKNYGVRQWEGLYIPYMTWKIIHSCKFTHQPVFLFGLYVSIYHKTIEFFHISDSNQWMIFMDDFSHYTWDFSSDKKMDTDPKKIQRLQNPINYSFISTIKPLWNPHFRKKSRAYKKKGVVSHPLCVSQ